jgi:hypothetical protein
MPPPKKVLTPGSYNVTKEKKKAAKKAKRGQLVVSTPIRMRKKQEKAKRRDNNTEQDIVEAIRLIKEEEFSIFSCQQLHKRGEKEPYTMHDPQ